MNCFCVNLLTVSAIVSVSDNFLRLQRRHNAIKCVVLSYKYLSASFILISHDAAQKQSYSTFYAKRIIIEVPNLKLNKVFDLSAFFKKQDIEAKWRVSF